MIFFKKTESRIKSLEKEIKLLSSKFECKGGQHNYAFQQNIHVKNGSYRLVVHATCPDCGKETKLVEEQNK